MASQWTLSFVSKSFFLLLPLSVAAPSCLFLPAVGSLQILRASRGGKRDWFAAPQSFTFANLACLAALPNSAFSRRSRFHQFEDSIKHW